MADDLKYGYKGAEPTQSFGNNTGVFDPNDINNLIADNKWTSFGQLELIETQTVSSVSFVDFKESDGTFDTSYNVHFLTINNLTTVNDEVWMRAKFYESGVLETASVYQYAHQYGFATGTFGEGKGTSSGSIQFGANVGNATSESGASYLYFYNLGDSSKYSFATYQDVSVNQSHYFLMNFGSGVMTQASTVDGIQFSLTSGNIETADVSLYGIRYS